MTKTYKRVLTIAGSDSGGGAGIQADLKTFSALGCYGMSAITAITAQNTVGVRGIHAIPVDMLEAQIDAVIEDIGVNAVKIGMLHSSEVINTVSKCLSKHDVEQVVLDPVMVATSGDVLLQPEAIKTLKDILIPQAKIITPNIPEAEILLDRKIEKQDELPQAARDLAATGCEAVLLKAGHLSESTLVDYLYLRDKDKLVALESQRLSTKNTHGTGCTLSSAIASYLAQGKELKDAVVLAKEYLTNAIISGSNYKIGEGHGPVLHFHPYWD